MDPRIAGTARVSWQATAKAWRTLETCDPARQLAAAVVLFTASVLVSLRRAPRQ